MTPEQVEELKSMLNGMKTAIADVESILDDASKCSSETSKKYLYAAAQKQASTITSHMKMPSTPR